MNLALAPPQRHQDHQSNGAPVYPERKLSIRWDPSSTACSGSAPLGWQAWMVGISWIEHGIRDYRATGAVLGMPIYLGRMTEALHLANRTSEAVEAEAEALAERHEQRDYSAEPRRLRGVFLATLGAEELQIEASFCKAIKIAKEQKSVSLQKRAEATYAEYRRQKAIALRGRGFRLPLW